jgi:hypothetical protein
MKTLAKTPGRSGRFLFPALALVLGCVAGVVLAELLLQMTWPGGDQYYYLWPPHLSSSVRPAPGAVHGIGPEAHHKVNSVGVLGEELPAKDVPQYRILTVGGSTTECAMLDQSKTWPSLVGTALARTADGRQVWLGNLGRSGFNSRDHLGAMRFVVGHYEPDAVVVLVRAQTTCYRPTQPR